MPSSNHRIAIVGSGPSALFLLKQLLQRLEQSTIRSDFQGLQITAFEQQHQMGMGMPYHPRYTDIYNLCNISSEEIPPLMESWADWLRACDQQTLRALGIDPEHIREDQTYCRIALGQYFQSQWRKIVNRLRQAGMDVVQRPGIVVQDIVDNPEQSSVTIVPASGKRLDFDRVVIATGHAFPTDQDNAESGYFSSPWPIHKILPSEGVYYRFAIGTLGASLSAFDVVSSLSHRHGKFEQDGDGLRFCLDPNAEGFRIVMHSTEGWLPQLQYEQREAFREIYRHSSFQQMLDLVDDSGFLRLDRYFDEVCRPALIKAFKRDHRGEIAAQLERDDFRLEDFIDQMTSEHSYDDAFEGMRQELPEARYSVEGDRPIHWKEVMDDLMYTLNYHADAMPADDHLRLGHLVMPFLMNVIAALPLQSARILLALRDAGVLELVTGNVKIVDRAPGQTHIAISNGDEIIESIYQLFIDCSGQGGIKINDYPFLSLIKHGTVRSARVRFADESVIADLPKEERRRVVDSEPASLELSGIDIDSSYRVIDSSGTANPRIYVIAFPHISGVRPYSYGLQSCNDTASALVDAWHQEIAHATVVDFNKNPDF